MHRSVGAGAWQGRSKIASGGMKLFVTLAAMAESETAVSQMRKSHRIRVKVSSSVDSDTLYFSGIELLFL